MVTLNCAIVGVAGSVFEVDIDENKLVGHLKKVIKGEKPNDSKDIDADKLQLFLAKKDGGAWLSSLTEDVKKLKKGEKTALIEALMEEDLELQAEDSLKDVLEENHLPTPLSRQVHVLVVVPDGAGGSVTQGLPLEREFESFGRIACSVASYPRGSIRD
uniref:Crinkler effector protein N-terminal domain-containing protein n=1 Tax=Phytophthora ramorum TaxID=164328 RepID=H3H8E4_PHYRM